MTDVIVVDVANVMGSRPDGWWRDRAGAARRLYDDVVASGLAGVVLVVEGAAKAGVEAGDRSGVRVVHAAGCGDDAIVDSVAALVGVAGPVMVVTSDRELHRRVRELGAEVAGPGWFRERLV